MGFEDITFQNPTDWEAFDKLAKDHGIPTLADLKKGENYSAYLIKTDIITEPEPHPYQEILKKENHFAIKEKIFKTEKMEEKELTKEKILKVEKLAEEEITKEKIGVSVTGIGIKGIPRVQNKNKTTRKIQNANGVTRNLSQKEDWEFTKQCVKEKQL